MSIKISFYHHSFVRGSRAVAGLAISAAVTFALLSIPASANDYSGCVAGYKRYNNNIKEYQYYINLCRSDGTGDAAAEKACTETIAICDRIAPSVGHAYCTKYIRSGYGTQAQRRWARLVATRLVQFYRGCQAQ